LDASSEFGGIVGRPASEVGPTDKARIRFTDELCHRKSMYLVFQDLYMTWRHT